MGIFKKVIYLAINKISKVETNQLKLLAQLAKQIKTEEKDKTKIITTLQHAGILTKQGNFTVNYKLLNKVFVSGR
jgi:hypothetical protein